MVKSVPIPCTKEEMDRLIAASMKDSFYYMLFQVAKKTGRRLGEYYDVQVKDIDFEKNIMVTKVLKRKKKVLKEAIIDDDLSYLLKRYIMDNKLKLEDYVFRKVSYRQIQRMVKKYSEDAGIPHNVSFHNFRHYFVTELVRKGWDHTRIAKLTGHSTPATLVLYDHSVASDIAEDARAAIKDI
jgi:integrase/recombinase XerD